MNKDQEIRNIIAEYDLAGILFFRPDELVMTLGYYPTWGASVCLYTQDAQPILYIPEIEPTAHLPKECTIKKYPYGRLGVDPWAQLKEMVAYDIIQLKLSSKALTFIKSIGGSALPANHGESPSLHEEILRQLCTACTKDSPDISPILLSLYDIKTTKDLHALQTTHEVSKQAIQSFYHHAKAGISEGELAAHIELDIKKMMNLTDKKHVAAWCYIHAGSNTAYSGCYAQSSGKIIEENDVILMELAICVNGYWADITRTTHIGAPNAKIQHIFSLVEEAQNRAIQAIKADVPMRRIDAIARDFIANHGFEQEFNHALGHQVGFRYHDPGANINPYSQGVLQEGMVITIEPGIYSSALGFGVRKEDNILVTNNSYVILSQ